MAGAMFHPLDLRQCGYVLEHAGLRSWEQDRMFLDVVWESLRGLLCFEFACQLCVKSTRIVVLARCNALS